jgi:predicted ATP-grasp superfamily ATP-dependent carboligase
MTIVIDSTTYDVPVISIKRKADFLDKFAERTEDGILHRELIGVYKNYELAFGRTTNTTAYAALWAKLTEAVEFHTVTVPDLDGASFTFTAYFASVSDELQRTTSAKTFWKHLTVNFIAQAPALTP